MTQMYLDFNAGTRLTPEEPRSGGLSCWQSRDPFEFSLGRCLPTKRAVDAARHDIAALFGASALRPGEYLCAGPIAVTS